MPDTLQPDLDRPIATAGLDVRRPRRRRRGRLVALLLLLAVIAAAGWWWLRPQPATTAAYTTAPVSRGDLAITVSALGTVEPLEYVDVGTQVSGQLQQLAVEAGDIVAVGDLLAQIDPTVYQAQVESDYADLMRLQAQLGQQEAQLTLAQQKLARQQQMLNANATSRESFESATADVAIASAAIEVTSAEIAKANSNLDADKANLDYTTIRAPMSGTVMSLTARQGQTLNANQSAPVILQIAKLDTMTVTTEVSEADIGRLTIGMDAYFTTLGEPGRRWTGTLRQILPTPTVENNVVLYNALFDVENPDGRLMPKMTAQVFFQIAATTDALLIPAAALGPPVGDPEGGQRTVRVLTATGVEQRTVTVGLQNRVSAEILAGLAEGERVVVSEAAPRQQGGGMFPPFGR